MSASSAAGVSGDCCEEAKDRALACVVCSCYLVDPVTLACLHSCCRLCAPCSAVKPASLTDGEQASQQESVVSASCPRCSKAWPGIEAAALGDPSLAENTFLAGCLTVRKERRLPAVCVFCAEEGTFDVPAAYRCLQCRKYLCKTCTDMHARFLKWHTTVPVAEFQTGPISALSMPAPRSCRPHRSNELAFYCQQCQLPKCVDCLMAVCHNAGHRYAPLYTQTNPLCQQLSSALQDVESSFAVLDRIKESCRDAVRQLEDQKDDALVMLATNKKMMFRVVDACYRDVEDRLKADVSELTSSVLRVEEECRLLGEAVSSSTGYARLLMDEGHQLDLLDQSHIVLTRLERLRQPESLAGVVCPGQPVMTCTVSPPDLSAIKLWLGMPHWSLSFDAIQTIGSAAAIPTVSSAIQIPVGEDVMESASCDGHK